MKKGFLFIIALVFAFFAFCGFYAKADSVTITMVDGAQVRTEGEYQGLRFQASVNTLEGASEHGFYLAIGEHTLSDMETAIEAGADNVGGNKLVKKNALGTETTFAITIYGIASDHYLDEITAVAFVKVGDDYIIDKVVTRNIAEVAIEARNFDKDAELINNVCTYASSVYYTAGWAADGTYKLTASIYDHDYKTLGNQFLADWNAKFGTTLTSFSASTLYASAKPAGCTYSASNNSNKDISDSNLYRFFKDEKYGVKWAWLLDYFISVGTSQGDTHTIRQAKAIKADGTFIDENATSNKDVLYGANHIIASIVGFFTKDRIAIWHWGLDFSVDSAYTGLASLDVITCSKNDYTYYKADDTLVLPARVDKTGYTWLGYTDSGSTLRAAESNYAVSLGATIFTPTYSAIEYSITYNLNGGTNSVSNPETYTIEDSVTLHEATKDGLLFKGWYETSNFSSARVYSIPVGTHIDKIYYAKFVEPITLGFVDDDWAGLAPGTVVTVQGNDYTIGDDAFATIGEALDAAADNATIKVLAGTYAENATVSSSGISLLGPNSNISAVDGARVDEANIDGIITLASKINNTTINGFSFINNSKITSTPEGDKGATSYNNTGINFIYNRVVSSLNAGKGFLNFEESDRSYSKDLVIDECSFEQTASGLNSLIYLQNNVNVTIRNSSFENIKSRVLSTWDSANTRGGAGNIIIEDNTFTNITGSIFWGDYVAGITYGVYSFKFNRNIVNRCDGQACIDIETGNTAATYVTFEIKGNTFRDVYKVIWLDRGSTTAIIQYNKFYLDDLTTGPSDGSKRYICKTNGQSASCVNNLYLSTDGNTVLTATSSGFNYNANVTGKSYYETIEEYNDAYAAYLAN